MCNFYKFKEASNVIILIGGEKGGTGKTTISTNLAAKMISKNEDVLLIDTDKQGSASAWCSVRDENTNVKRIPCIQKFGMGIVGEIKDLSTRYKNIIIDAGGRDSIELRSAMTVADKIYIPLQASQFDVWTIAAMDNLVSLAKPMNPQLRAFLIINRASTNPSVSESKDVMDLFEDIEHLKILNCILRDRIAYRKAAQRGLAVFELDQPDNKSVCEIDSFYEEVRDNSE
jgi:chromosome partitioning protein